MTYNCLLASINSFKESVEESGLKSNENVLLLKVMCLLPSLALFKISSLSLISRRFAMTYHGIFALFLFLLLCFWYSWVLKYYLSLQFDAIQQFWKFFDQYPFRNGNILLLWLLRLQCNYKRFFLNHVLYVSCDDFWFFLCLLIFIDLTFYTVVSLFFSIDIFYYSISQFINPLFSW